MMPLRLKIKKILQKCVRKVSRSRAFHGLLRPFLMVFELILRAEKRGWGGVSGPGGPYGFSKMDFPCVSDVRFFVRKSCHFLTVRASLGRDGAVVAMLRRPRCIAGRALLQSRKGLTAGWRRAKWNMTELMLFVSCCELAVCEICDFCTGKILKI